MVSTRSKLYFLSSRILESVQAQLTNELKAPPIFEAVMTQAMEA